MAHYKMPILEEKGFVVLDSYGDLVDPVNGNRLVRRLEVLRRYSLCAAG